MFHVCVHFIENPSGRRHHGGKINQPTTAELSILVHHFEVKLQQFGVEFTGVAALFISR
jgi:hypothetical protein